MSELPEITFIHLRIGHCTVTQLSRNSHQNQELLQQLNNTILTFINVLHCHNKCYVVKKYIGM